MKFKLISNNELLISLSKESFNRSIVFKCFYWYGDKYSISINEDSSNFHVELGCEKELSNSDLLIQRIKSDLIDFKTRDIIRKETKNIRELLIAKAFAFEEGFDEEPPGDINDPIGFYSNNN